MNNRRVPLRYRILYGLGYLTVALTADMTLTWVLKRYRPDPADPRWNVLVTAGALFAAMLLGRIIDGIADPLVGYWSDRIRTRWGKRKPFILLGAPLLAITFVLLWLPPDDTATAANAVYLAIMAAAFFFAFTVVVCPYLAMLPEITSDPGERVALATWQGGFNIAGAVGGMAVAGFLIEAHGYRTMALSFAPIILLCAWAPLLVPTPLAQQTPCTFRLADAIGRTLANPLFLPYVVSQALFWIALRIVLAAGPKIIEVRAAVRETEQGLVMATALVSAALALPLVSRLAGRNGKRRVLKAAMLHYGLEMIQLALVGILPIGLAPLWQAVVIMALVGPAVGALFTLPNAMVADIVDRDEDETGQRREAIYFGVQGLLVKAGLGLGIGIAALLLDWLGETTARQGGFTACALAATVLSWAAAVALTRYRGD